MENASPAEDSFHRPSTNNNGVMENASPADHFLRHQSDVGTSLQIDPQLLGVQGSAMIDPQLLGEGSTQAQLQSQQGGVARLPVKSSGIKMTLRSLSKKPVSELAVLSDDSLSANPNNFHFECPLRSCPWVFDAYAPYSLFAAHVVTHGLELFNSGRIRTCYFGCHEGFIDEVQRRYHTMRCPSYGKLPLESKVATPCPAEGCSYNGIDHAAHWSSAHNPEAYSDARNAHGDECCRKAWMDPHVFHRHIVVTSARINHQCIALNQWQASMIVHQMRPVIGHFFAPSTSSLPPRTSIPRPRQVNNDVLNSQTARPDAVSDILQTVVWPTADVWPTPLDATQHLEPDDLAQLWISRISAQPPNVVQYPEVCTNGDVTVWRINNFDVDMMLPADVRELQYPQHSQPAPTGTLIPTDTLTEKFVVAGRSRRLHLVFVFRYGNPTGEDHVEEHFWNPMDAAASFSVSLAGDTIETISIICTEKTKGRYI
jgi:hypothetical protein